MLTTRENTALAKVRALQLSIPIYLVLPGGIVVGTDRSYPSAVPTRHT